MKASLKTYRDGALYKASEQHKLGTKILIVSEEAFFRLIKSSENKIKILVFNKKKVIIMYINYKRI